MDFFPRVEYTTGSLELNVWMRDSKRTGGNNSTETAYDSLTERIRLYADGYVYHPRFLIFRLGGSAGLIQAETTMTGAPSQNTSHPFNEYDAGVTLLPAHPYNLELFTRRQQNSPNPLSAESSVNSVQGALFRYKQKPLFFHLNAILSSFERRVDRSDAKQYTAEGSYFIGPTTNNAGYDRTETTTSWGQQSVRTNSYFTNILTLGPVSLTSNVGTGRQQQNGPAEAPSFRQDTSAWSERLSAQLPLHFSFDAGHSYNKQETTTEQAPSSPERTVFNKTTTNSLAINHQLYSSLRTGYHASEQLTQTTGGDTDSSQQTLFIAYTKKIPNGDLRAGYSIQDQTLARRGAAVIVNEPHTSVAVPGVLPLNNQAANPSTIIVMVRNPNPPQDLVTLTENVNYTVQQFGTVLQITVLNLPPHINPPAPAYDFLVSYSLLRNNSELDIDRNTFNLGFSFLDGLFSPFFSYSTSDEKVISGTFPGGDSTTKTTTYGYTAVIKPFTLYMERIEYQSEFSPYRSVRATTDYRKLFNEDIDIVARLSYVETEHLATLVSNYYFEKTTNMEVTVHTVFPHENLELFAGGVYMVSKVTGMTTTSDTLNASLRWHKGLLDVLATASKTYTVMEGTTGRQTHAVDALFLTVSRKIF